MLGMIEKGSNHQMLKQKNSHLIRKFIYQNSPISRVEVAQELGLTTPTITGGSAGGRQERRPPPDDAGIRA